MMTVEERNAFIKDVFLNECLPLLESKGKDYASGGSANDNFYRTGRLLGVNPSVVWTIFYLKHHDALMQYLREGQVASEPVWGRIIDMINYLAILLTMMEEDCRAAQTGHNDSVSINLGDKVGTVRDTDIDPPANLNHEHGY